MIVEYAVLLVLGVLGFYMLAPPASSAVTLAVSIACALLCVVCVFLIWRLFRDK